MDPVAGRGASGEAPGSRLRMSYAGLLCLRSAESEVCVVTMSKRCPNEVRRVAAYMSVSERTSPYR